MLVLIWNLLDYVLWKSYGMKTMVHLPIVLDNVLNISVRKHRLFRNIQFSKLMYIYIEGLK